MEEEGYNEDAFLVMDEVLESLKLLDYENLFCKQKGFKPLSHVHFATASSDQS